MLPVHFLVLILVEIHFISVYRELLLLQSEYLSLQMHEVGHSFSLYIQTFVVQRHLTSMLVNLQHHSELDLLALSRLQWIV